jgi:hypothetical protein
MTLRQVEGAVACRVYAVLLRLHPSPFVRMYGRDMRDAFEVRVRRLGAAPLHRLWIFYLVNFFDVVRSAGLEWLHHARHHGIWRGEFRRPRVGVPAGIGLLVITLGICGAILPATYRALASQLPFRDPARLVRLGERSSVLRTDYVSPLTFDDWRSHNNAFEDLAAFRHWQNVPLEDWHGPSETVTHVASTANFFALLGVEPILGRTFRDEQRIVGSESVVSYQFWRDHLRADANVIGRVIRLQGIETTIVGVLPSMSPGLALGWGDVWTCLYRYDVAQQRATSYKGRYLTVIGRLAHGVTADDARRRLDAVQHELSQNPSSVAAGFDATLVPLRTLSDAQRAIVVAIAAAAGIALLSSLGFVALRGLLAVRRRGVRRNGRSPLSTAVFVAVGLGLAAMCVTSFSLSRFLGDVPGLEETRYGWSALAVAALCFMASRIPTSLPLRFNDAQPYRAFNVAPTWPLRERWIASYGLTALQLGLAVLLIACTGLVWRSVTELSRVNAGFDAQKAWTLDVFVPASTYRSEPDYIRFIRSVLDDLSATPHSSAGALLYFPQRSKVWPTPVWVRDFQDANTSEHSAYFNLIAGNALSAMGTRVEAGRLPTFDETFDGTAVAVINHALATSAFPDGDVLGRHVRTDPDGPWFEVIGVVEDMRQHSLDLPGEPEVFLPFWAMPMPFVTFVVRADVPTGDLGSWIRATVERHDTRLPLAAAEPLTTSMRPITDQRFVFAVLAVLASIVVITLALSAHDIGRTAFASGLTRPAAARRVAYGVVTAALPGLALGTTAITAAMARADSLLFAVGPQEVLVFCVASALAGSALLAMSAAVGVVSLRPTVRIAG